MDNKYEIIEGDCLELIAKRLGISIDELQAMNSDQIKNVDLIYAGNLLNIPANDDKSQDSQAKSEPTYPDDIKPAEVSAERIQLPELPKAPTDMCETKEYVDVVFYPSMPKTGKQGWFALTQQAKDKLEEEIKNMRSIMLALSKGNSNDAMMELSKYGILSKFQSTDHERFLEDKDDKDRYRALLYFQLALKIEAKRLPAVLFYNEFKNEEVKKEFISHYLKAYKEQEFWAECKSLLNITLEGARQTSILRFFTESPSPEELRINYLQVRQDAIGKVVTKVADEIEKLEVKARKQASKNLSDDGTPFAYSDSMNYFTSEQQKTIHSALGKVHQARGMYSLELGDICSKEPETLLDKLKLWQRDSEVAVRLTPYEFSNQFAGRFTPILTLNTHLMVLIEQCLTDDELIKVQPQTVKYYQDLDAAAEKKLIREVFQSIPGLKAMHTVPGEALPWSYYPCIALLHKLEASLKKKLAELQDLLGVSSLPKEILGDLVWCKKALLARVAHFEQTAKKHAAESEYQRLFTPANKVYTPILNEKAWKPAKKAGSLYTQAGKADLTVVECYLASEGGKTAFVRGPSWLVPDSDATRLDCADHLFDLNPGFKSAEAMKPALKQRQIADNEPIPPVETSEAQSNTHSGILDKGITAYLNKLPVSKSFKENLVNIDKVFVSKKIYHWTSAGPKIDETVYHINAECQFMRFSSAVSVGDDLDITKLTDGIKNKSAKFGLVEASADLNLAKGQATLTFEFPSAAGYAFIIPYIAYLPAKPLKINQETLYKAAREEQPGWFNAGNIKLQGALTLYGMVGASVNLGASVEFGNLDQGGVGVRGFSQSYQNYNAHRRELGQINNADGQLLAQSKAADITATAGVFAGVEVGGELVGSIKWKAPGQVAGQVAEKGGDKNGFVPFGQFTAQASVAFGAAANGMIKLTVSGGKIIFILAARLALGPGAGGKFGFEISPLVINDFIDHILTIMDKEGFRRLNLFDESIDSDSKVNSFELFNMFLTAVMVTGLKAADVLLLPFEQIQALNKEDTREKLAPVLADFINEDAEKALPWVKKLPPETLGRLLFTLTEKQSYGWKEQSSDFVNISGNPKKSQDDRNDSKQRFAIQEVLLWMVDGSISTSSGRIIFSGPTENQRRHFEETLVRMSAKGKKPDDYKEEWQAFMVNLQRIIFIYESSILLGGNKGEAPRELLSEILEFRNFLSVLCNGYEFYREMKVFTFGNMPAYVGDKYVAVYVGDCKSDPVEQSERKKSLNITSSYELISVVDIKGKE